MNRYLEELETETSNPRSKNIDQLTTLEMVRLMNEEDAQVAKAVGAEAENIAEAVERISESFRAGGRLIYVGAGTSGRLGILDASEAPPTFGTDPAMVQGHIAGGETAIRHAVERAEDNTEEAVRLIEELNITDKDTVVGITASGFAPYVIAAVEEAGKRGATTIGLVTNENTNLEKVAQVTIAPKVGPEVIMGSTRLKSGTAQKMVLNMLTTLSMVKIGKVYGNLMVDLKATNQKLVERALRIVVQATGASQERALEALEQADMHGKTAIMMIKTDTTAEVAERYLERTEGHLEAAVQLYGEEDNAS